MRFVIYHPKDGVFIGVGLGLGFWSRLEDADQDSACTFESTKEAEDFMKTWKNGIPEGVEYRGVTPDIDKTYISKNRLRLMGLW